MNKLQFIANSMIQAPKNLIYRTLNKPLAPQNVVIAITDRCNSRCHQCNIWKIKDHAQNPITPAEIYHVLSNPLMKEIQSIINTGGECTLRDDLVEIIQAEHKALPKATLTISTNGILWERVVKVVEYCRKEAICLSVGLSLDGFGIRHDEARGVPGNFEKVDKLIHWLDHNKADYVVGFTLTEKTKDNLIELANYLKPFNKVPFVQWENQSAFYNREDRPKPTNEMYGLVKSLNIDMIGSLLIKESWLHGLKGKDMGLPCFAMQRFFVLKCNGDIVPCLTKWDDKVGNIREHGIDEIWNSRDTEICRMHIKNCSGCLNSWATAWSYKSAFYPYLTYFKHPKELLKAIR